MKKLLLMTLLLSSNVIFANEEGKELHEESCMRCHGSEMYTRDNSKIQNNFDLRSQVSFCASNLGTGWFPDEEKSVVDYLNGQYYKFKK
jgi:mono/diheme cytochrome c family protein